uniref:NADH-ubiquinone oxidoreductase chain 2 n=1 Tax=Spadella cephaloptera TaxID=52888 RepID=A0A141CKC8_9BILA|nr:NADH dehydrogenase subunit 2 [Spadella cephaloptera]
MKMGVLFGILCAVSSNNWLFVWMGMEINLMCFLALLSGDKSSKKKISLYFITQSFGSLLLLAVSISQSSIMSMVLVMALTLKMGAMPFHFWTPPVAMSMSWSNLILFLTVQKISPLILLKSALHTNSMFFMMAINALLGGFMVLSCNNMPMMMLFSSIIHLSWLFSALWTLYFWDYLYIYMIILTAIIYFYYNKKNASMQLSLINFGGIPPFLGFSVKLKTMMELNKFHIPFLLSGSMMSLYAYIRFLLVSSVTKKKKIAEKISPITILLLIPQ